MNRFDDTNAREPDILDQASEAERMQREARERLIREKAQPEKHAGFDGKHCIEPDCGVEIPAERLALGKIRCVDCQTLREKREKQGG